MKKIGMLRGLIAYSIGLASVAGLPYLAVGEPTAPIPELVALHFDGENDYVEIPPSRALDLRGSVTVSVRVRSDGVKGNAEQIFWRGDTRPGLDPYSLVINDGRMAFVMMFTQETALQAIASFPMDRNYHFWTGVYDKTAAEIRLYMDGKLVAMTPANAEINYDTSGMWNTIGAVDHGGWQNFHGAIAEVQVWGGVRDSSQIHMDMQGDLRADTPGLAGYWDFREGEVQTLHDRSLFGSDGRLGETPGDDDHDPVWRIEPRSKGPIHNPDNGHAYVIFDEPCNWEEARAAAEVLTIIGIHGHLATLTTREENDWVLNHLDFGGAAVLWIGGDQAPGSAEPGQGWRWATGEPWDFANWIPGEPNNCLVLDAPEDCVSFESKTGQWNDLTREKHSLPAIIEFDFSPPPKTPPAQE